MEERVAARAWQQKLFEAVRGSSNNQAHPQSALNATTGTAPEWASSPWLPSAVAAAVALALLLALRPRFIDAEADDGETEVGDVNWAAVLAITASVGAVVYWLPRRLSNGAANANAPRA